MDQNQNIIHALSGGVSSLLSTLILQPLQNIQSRMHVEDQNQNVIEMIKKVYNDQGFQGLYKGIESQLIGNTTAYAIYFYHYQYFKQYFNIDSSDSIGILKVSYLAGIISATLTNPFWVINSKITLNQDKQSSAQIFQKMIKEEGWKSLTKGLLSSLILVFNPMIQFAVYEYLKKIFKNNQSFAIIFLIAVVSKAIATLLTYPYQVIRTNVQLQKNKTHLQVFQEIIKKNGLFGLFKGLDAKITQTVLNAGFMMSYYEKILELMIVFSKK